jgi:hypothetical protein
MGLCVFDTTTVAEPVLATARHTHPQLRTATGRQINPGYVDPASYLRAPASGSTSPSTTATSGRVAATRGGRGAAPPVVARDTGEA